ncbi:MAG TPA: DinB family protein [Acidimicrobiia bacterium]
MDAETERAGLCEFLDMQREALIGKIRGLSEEDARRAPTASSLSLLSLIKHSAIWERRWFQVIVAGRSVPDEWSEMRTHDDEATFRLSDDDTVAIVVAHYREQIAASQEIVGSVDLDAPCALPEMAHVNARWVALHMIEETARHAGHADIIRETIDGSRGR